jgi:hypothetical protein
MGLVAAICRQMRHDRCAMSSDWLPRGFDEISSEELERSMEHEVEGLMELDDLDLIPSTSEHVTADPLRAERSGSRGADRRPAAQPSGRHPQG